MRKKHLNNTPLNFPPASAPNTAFPEDFPTAGELPVKMTNDYLFHAIFQSNEAALKGLVCALLHMRPDKITSIKVTNPIILGEGIDFKTTVLDLLLILNDKTYLNLELQAENEGDWPDRSLLYLFRTVNVLKKGEPYQNLPEAIHVGILDYALFSEYPEFYATYMFLNVKNHQKYSDKVQISVLNLNRIDLATEEDKVYHLDAWASLFKAKTWEELHMLANQNQDINEAVLTLQRLSADEKVRLQCWALEDYERRMNKINHMAEIIADMEAEVADKDAEIADKDAQIADKAAEIADKDAQIADKDAQIADKDAQIAALKAQLSFKQ